VQVRKHSQGEGSTTFKPPADGAPASPDKGGATSPYAQPFQHNNTPAAAPAKAAPPIPEPDYSMSEVRTHSSRMQKSLFFIFLISVVLKLFCTETTACLYYIFCNNYVRDTKL